MGKLEHAGLLKRLPSAAVIGSIYLSPEKERASCFGLDFIRHLWYTTKEIRK